MTAEHSKFDYAAGTSGVPPVDSKSKAPAAAAAVDPTKIRWSDVMKHADAVLTTFEKNSFSQQEIDTMRSTHGHRTNAPASDFFANDAVVKELASPSRRTRSPGKGRKRGRDEGDMETDEGRFGDSNGGSKGEGSGGGDSEQYMGCKYLTSSEVQNYCYIVCCEYTPYIRRAHVHTYTGMHSCIKCVMLKIPFSLQSHLTSVVSLILHCLYFLPWHMPWGRYTVIRSADARSYIQTAACRTDTFLR
jgi:hypothetical protein